MRKIILLQQLLVVAVALTIKTPAFAQGNTKILIDIKEAFDKFYARTDSIHKAQPTLTIGDTLFKDLKNLDSTGPYNFFGAASTKYEFEIGKFDEAAIYYYVGLIRYKYYMGVNPGYPPSGGWVTTESLRQRVNKRIELYLQTNIDKYIAVLKYAINYCNQNDYTYWQKRKEILMHEKAIKPYQTLLSDLQTNRDKYVLQWQEERERNLNPNSLSRDVVRKKMEEEMAAKVRDMSKLILEAAALRTKIKEDNDDTSASKIQNQKRLDEIEKTMANYATESTQRKIAILAKELEDLKAANDTTKILYQKAVKNINVDTAKSKTDIYDYYDEQKRINQYKYIKSKERLAILELINKKDWDENKKITVFKLVYDESDTAKSIDRTKDIYITKIEQKKQELESFQNIIKANEEKRERLNRLKQMLGEIEARKLWLDVQAIFDTYIKQYTAN